MMLAMPLFSLGWTHSVEKTRWEEDGQVDFAFDTTRQYSRPPAEAVAAASALP